MKPLTLMILLGAGLLAACGTSSESGHDTAPAVDIVNVRGIWVNEITVTPNPAVTNEITFSGGETEGHFLDQFGHSGTWALEGRALTWIYVGVPELDNTFAGTIDASGQVMTGQNFGTWQGAEFEGTWTATKKAEPPQARM